MIAVINFPDVFITVLSGNIWEGVVDEAGTIFYTSAYYSLNGFKRVFLVPINGRSVPVRIMKHCDYSWAHFSSCL